MNTRLFNGKGDWYSTRTSADLKRRAEHARRVMRQCALVQAALPYLGAHWSQELAAQYSGVADKSLISEDDFANAIQRRRAHFGLVIEPSEAVKAVIALKTAWAGCP